jgi:hypothetical protein
LFPSLFSAVRLLRFSFIFWFTNLALFVAVLNVVAWALASLSFFLSELPAVLLPYSRTRIHHEVGSHESSEGDKPADASGHTRKVKEGKKRRTSPR